MSIPLQNAALTLEDTAVPETSGRAVRAKELSYVREVDALRALAVSAVIVFHCEVMHFGWAGVWLFFVISGFAITTSLLNSDAHRPSRWLLIRNFYIRRTLRIWPLYFGYAALASLVLINAGLTPPLSDLPWIATFTENFRQIFRDYTANPSTYWIGFGILWTLAVEEQFYLVFPFLFAFLSRRALVKTLIVLIALAPLVRYGVGAWAHARGWINDDTGRAVFAFMPAQMDSFAVGCLIALLRPHIEGNLRLARIALAMAAMCVVLYIAVYGYLGWREHGASIEAVHGLFRHHNYGVLREMWVYSVMVAVSGTLIVLILAGEKWMLWLTRLPLVQYIGKISYGAYIFHAIVIWALYTYVWDVAVAQDLGKIHRFILLALSYPTILLLAHFSYQYYEKRFLEMRKHFG